MERCKPEPAALARPEVARNLEGLAGQSTRFMAMLTNRIHDQVQR